MSIRVSIRSIPKDLLRIGDEIPLALKQPLESLPIEPLSPVFEIYDSRKGGRVQNVTGYLFDHDQVLKALDESDSQVAAWWSCAAPLGEFRLSLPDVVEV